MPVHDWTRVEAGIYHAFHQNWIVALAAGLNEGILPDDYYALPEQYAAGFGPDVLTLQGGDDNDDSTAPASPNGNTGLLVAAPTLAPTAETDMEFYRRKQTQLVVRHVSGDRVTAVIEIISPGNNSTANALRSFVQKAAEFPNQGVHLLIVDLFPTGPRDSHGLHAVIWDDVAGQAYTLPAVKPLTLAAYEAGLSIRAYIRHVAVGDVLPDMPLFLKPNRYVPAPLENAYQTAFAAMPRRWRRVLESAT
jgi:hypothetical protein